MIAKYMSDGRRLDEPQNDYFRQADREWDDALRIHARLRGAFGRVEHARTWLETADTEASEAGAREALAAATTEFAELKGEYDGAVHMAQVLDELAEQTQPAWLAERRKFA